MQFIFITYLSLYPFKIALCCGFILVSVSSLPLYSRWRYSLLLLPQNLGVFFFFFLTFLYSWLERKVERWLMVYHLNMVVVTDLSFPLAHRHWVFSAEWVAVFLASVCCPGCSAFILVDSPSRDSCFPSLLSFSPFQPVFHLSLFPCPISIISVLTIS